MARRMDAGGVSGRIIPVALALFLLSSIVPSLLPCMGAEEPSSSNGTRAGAEAKITMDQVVKTARGEPGESGLVIFTGTLEVQTGAREEFVDITRRVSGSQD